MGTSERSFGDVFQDIVVNSQDIIRAEVRLAKAEFQQELAQRQAVAFVLGVGTLAGVYAIGFLLLALLYALARQMPHWAAALVVALGLAIVAGITIAAGLARLKRSRLMPKSIGTVKE